MDTLTKNCKAVGMDTPRWGAGGSSEGVRNAVCFRLCEERMCTHVCVRTHAENSAQSVNTHHTHNALHTHPHTGSAQSHPVQPTETALAQPTMCGRTIMQTPHTAQAAHTEQDMCRPNRDPFSPLNSFILFNSLY